MRYPAQPMPQQECRCRALRIPCLTWAASLGLALATGCNNAPPAKDIPQEAASSTTTGATTPTTSAPTASTGTVAAVDAGAPSTDDAANATPPLATDTWATLATAKKTIVAKYPADVFAKTKLAGESMILTSKLERGLLGEGTGNQKHRFEIEIDWATGTPFEAVRKKFKTYPFPQMFPKGTEDSYVEQPDGFRLTVSGHAGYRVHTGVEGYDEDTVLLAIDPKKTLRFRCTYVGSVMGPEIDEDKQLAICDAVLGALVTAAP